MAFPARIKIKVRQTAPKIKVKSLVKFPARIEGAGGLTVTKANGVYTFKPDLSLLQEEGAPALDANHFTWVWDSISNDYVRVATANFVGVEGPQGPQGDPGPQGPAGLTWRGVWNSISAYVVNDAVEHNGSSYIAIAPNTNSEPPSANWELLAEKGTDGAGTGDVVGPASATDNAIARYDGLTGKLIQNSGAFLDDTGFITGPGITTGNEGLKAQDTNGSHALVFKPGSDLTAERILTITTGDAARTLTIGADSSISGTAYVAGGTDVAIADGGTGASTAATAFSNLKQAATDAATGVVELATAAEIVTGTDTVRAVTPAGLVGAQLFPNIPQNSRSAAYTLVAADAQKHIFHPSADTTARIWTIPANASVAFPIGTAVTFINQNAGGVITIAITTDTMRLAGAGTTGSRALAANGVATAIKVTSTEWIISGTGLT